MWTVLLLAALKTAPQRRTTSSALHPTAPQNLAVRSFSPAVFVQHATNMPPAQPPATFRAWPALNDEATRMAVNAGRRFRLHLANETPADPTYALFEGDALMNRFALALARRRSIDRKEYFESCEFFARARRKLRADGGGAGATTLVDVAGGHGLVGVLAAKNLEAIFVLRGALFTSWISFGFAGLVLRASSPKGGAGARGGAILVAYAAVSSVVSSYLSLRN